MTKFPQFETFRSCPRDNVIQNCRLLCNFGIHFQIERLRSTIAPPSSKLVVHYTSTAFATSSSPDTETSTAFASKVDSLGSLCSLLPYGQNFIKNGSVWSGNWDTVRKLIRFNNIFPIGPVPVLKTRCGIRFFSKNGLTSPIGLPYIALRYQFTRFYTLCQLSLLCLLLTFVSAISLYICH